MNCQPRADPAASRFGTRWLGACSEWHESCASTNDLAMARGRAGAESGLVVLADSQTAGRGRLGRVWHSPPGENLYLSVLLRPARPAAEIPPLTLLAGAAVAGSLAALGLAPRLKWPNDVELVEPVERHEGGERRRKVAGILTETATAGHRVEQVVVGIGLNVNGTSFPPELGDRATSLRQALGRPIDRQHLLAAVLGALEALYEDFERRGPVAAVEAFIAHAALPARVRLGSAGATGQIVGGTALGVDPDGALRFRDDDGRVHRVVSGELLP